MCVPAPDKPIHYLVGHCEYYWEANVSNKSSADPSDAFRETITKWERGFDSLANQLMGTEGYSKSMNQMQDLRLSMQSMYKEFMTQNLTNANMPTRDDLVRIGEYVQNLDKRMARVEALLETMVPSNAVVGSGPRKGPPRTKKAPSHKVKKASSSSTGDKKK